jgi:REP element-mobilizing transposase RayT
MRQPRLKAPPTHDHAFYHCISRIVDRQFLLGDPEKEKLLSFIREYAQFCGVQVVTYCLMSNHFHLLVKVPKPPAQPPSDESLLQRLEALSGLTGAITIRQRLQSFRQQGHHDAAEELRQSLLARMHDISVFMKLVKQRFTSWYNRQHARVGTLWEQRFKSLLVQSAGPTLATMAAYIDLNPIRAKIVDLPEQYRWSGYGEAMSGSNRMKAAYQEMLAGYLQPADDVLAAYRIWLYGQGEENEGTTERGAPIRPGLDRDKVKEIMEAKGKMALHDYLRCRVRYFSDGLVLGTRTFVNEIFVEFRERFGPKRKDGARRMAGMDQPLFTMRALQVNPVT